MLVFQKMFTPKAYWQIILGRLNLVLDYESHLTGFFSVCKFDCMFQEYFA